MKDIIEEIYEKMHECFSKKNGKHPTMLTINREHYISIMKHKDWMKVIKPGEYPPATIMGMLYEIKDVLEISVR